MKILLCTLICCLAFAGCGGEKDEKFGINTLGSSTSLINAQATSCAGTASGTRNDVSARYFRLSPPTLTWADTESEAHVTEISFVLSNGPMGDLTQTIGADEILALFGISATSGKDPVLAKATIVNGVVQPTQFTLVCQLLVGGFTIDQKVYNYPIEFNGKGTVAGFKRNTVTGDEEEFTKDFYFTVRYSGTN